MAIHSRNHNPQNDSKYARHRSTSKGRNSQIQRVVNALQTEQRNIFLVIQDDLEGLVTELSREVGQAVVIKADRVKPQSRGQVLGSWQLAGDEVPQIPDLWLRNLNPSLRGDLKLIWLDFLLIAGRRRPDGNSGNFKEYLLVVAISPNKLDLIFSKYGYRSGHHFFHWQAAGEGVGNAHIDDLFLMPHEVGAIEAPGFTLV
jgi:hypothetical protein